MGNLEYKLFKQAVIDIASAKHSEAAMSAQDEESSAQHRTESQLRQAEPSATEEKSSQQQVINASGGMFEDHGQEDDVELTQDDLLLQQQ